MSKSTSANSNSRLLSIALVSFGWLATTLIFWTGYVGSDDFIYSRYAWLLHRPPISWWEFRMPFILALRASFKLFGPHEIAATVPTLLASLAILASVAKYVDWPRKLTWQTQLSMLIAATIPVEVGFRTVPYASFFATGLLSLGTVFLLEEGPLQAWVAAPLLALGFLTHEVTFFYVAILCLTLLAFDWRRYWRPVLVVVLVCGLAFAVECSAYWYLLGEPLARFKTAAARSGWAVGYDPDINLGGIRFYTWPIENLIFGKAFGFDLLLLLIAGLVAWRNLVQTQRVLFVVVFAFWAWFGFGTQVPWVYSPFGRQMHYYMLLTLGVAALLPSVVSIALAARPMLWRAVLVGVVFVHLFNLSAGGRWGQDVRVSEQLLRYANAHAEQHFVTDVRTMNQLYVLSGFRLPSNVVCLNGPAVLNSLRLNDEPAATPRFQFPEARVDAALINSEAAEAGKPDADFQRFLREHPLDRVRLIPVRYKFMFRPFVRFMHPRSFMILNLGAEVAGVDGGPVTVNQ